MDSIKESFVEALEREFRDLELANPEKKKAIVSNIDTLAGQYVDILKEENDHDEAMERLRMEQSQHDDGLRDHRDELALKEEELEEKKKTRKWNAGIAIGSSVLGSLMTVLMSAAMFHFEESHSFTSSMRNGIQKYVFDLFKRNK